MDLTRNIEKIQASGSEAGDLIHDINNVLGTIMGAAALIELDLKSGHPSLKEVGIILSACRKGRDLTRDLSGFARGKK